MTGWNAPTWRPSRGIVRFQILVLTCGLAFTAGIALLNLVRGDGSTALRFLAFCFVYVPGLLISWQQWRSFPSRPLE